jgi:hypothetical protein
LISIPQRALASSPGGGRQIEFDWLDEIIAT